MHASPQKPVHSISRRAALSTSQTAASENNLGSLASAMIPPALRSGTPFATLSDNVNSQALVRSMPEWRNGRRDGLKIRCPQGRVGSSPSSGTLESWTQSGVCNRAAPRCGEQNSQLLGALLGAGLKNAHLCWAGWPVGAVPGLPPFRARARGLQPSVPCSV